MTYDVASWHVKWEEARVMSSMLLPRHLKRSDSYLVRPPQTEGLGSTRKLLFIDVRKAYFNAKVDRPTFVELPPDMQWAGHCGRLIRCMYGTKCAAMRLTRRRSSDWALPKAEHLPAVLPTRRVTSNSLSMVTTSPSLDAMLI